MSVTNLRILAPARQSILAQYEREVAADAPESLNEIRQAFVGRYGPDRFRTASDADLLTFFHGTGPREGLFYELEYDTRTFGSIAGGYAARFLIYRAPSGDWKTVGPSNTWIPCTEEQAVETTRSIARDLLSAMDLAARLDLAAGDRDAWRRIQAEAPTLAQRGWFHKYLALNHPELFSFHHSVEQLQGHLVRLGIEPEEGRWLVDWQWRQARQSDPLVAPLHPVSLMRAMYDALGQNTRYWRVEIDGGLWEAMRSRGCVSLAWPDLGDLRQEIGALGPDAARQRLWQMLSPSHPDRSAVNDVARQIYSFYAEVKRGDRVAAMRGRDLLGVGIVSDEYLYDDEAHLHLRPVHWSSDAQSLPAMEVPDSRKALHEFTRKRDLTVSVERVLAGSALLEVEPVPLPPRSGRPLVGIDARIHQILARKGQVILYGPPGTGKTWNARNAAREIVARERFAGQSYADLTPSQRREAEAGIDFCTFHPAYAYEDFIEGFRPEIGSGGAPAFKLNDGIFLEACRKAAGAKPAHHVLIIDEINRGNLPAIMGELITLLEADKRENLPVTLPYSRRSFTVPTNLWIIATMNTADRSISLLDAALRRRFGFLELLPDPDTLSEVDGLSLKTLLLELNRRVRQCLPRSGRELQIGHSYFMKGGGTPLGKSDLLHIMRDEVIPLLAEYCFENFSALREILGDEIVEMETQTLRAEALSDADRMYVALTGLLPEEAPP